MLTKRQVKLIHSLSRKKIRDAEGCFIAEGHRAVDDFLTFCPCRLLAATPEYIATRKFPNGLIPISITPRELHDISQQKTPQDVVAIFEQPTHKVPTTINDLTLALDCIQDPGNMGTIIRMADWMGIRHIFCSPDTVDIYSPKVVQSTMGALSRVAVHYLPLSTFLAKAKVPIYGTFLEGTSLYSTPLKGCAIVVMGNEGNGISTEIEQYVSDKIHIPTFAKNKECVESLNVGVAAAIVCSEIRRQNINKR